MDRLRDLIDPSDELYVNQKSIVDADGAFYLTELLADPSDAVAMRAAITIARLSDHSAHAKARIHAGPLLGLDNAPYKLLFNPIQSRFLGAIATLVPWLVCGFPTKANVAAETLASLCSYHHDGKVEYVKCLVEQASDGIWAALGHLIDGVGGLEWAIATDEDDGNDMAGILEGLKSVLEQALRAEGRDSQNAMALLGALCQKDGHFARSMRQTGQVPQILVSFILRSDTDVAQDNAVYALWHVAKDDVPAALGPESGVFLEQGMVLQFKRRLVNLIRVGEEQEIRANDDAPDDGRRETWVSEDEGGGPSSWCNNVLNADQAGEVGEICYLEEARHLLAALKMVYPGVSDIEGEAGSPTRRTSCAVM